MVIFQQYSTSVERRGDLGGLSPLVGDQRLPEVRVQNKKKTHTHTHIYA